MAKQLTRKDLQHAKGYGVSSLSQNELRALIQFAIDNFQEPAKPVAPKAR